MTSEDDRKPPPQDCRDRGRAILYRLSKLYRRRRLVEKAIAALEAVQREAEREKDDDSTD